MVLFTPTGDDAIDVVLGMMVEYILSSVEMFECPAGIGNRIWKHLRSFAVPHRPGKQREAAELLSGA